MFSIALFPFLSLPSFPAVVLLIGFDFLYCTFLSLLLILAVCFLYYVVGKYMYVLLSEMKEREEKE